MRAVAQRLHCALSCRPQLGARVLAARCSSSAAKAAGARAAPQRRRGPCSRASSSGASAGSSMSGAMQERMQERLAKLKVMAQSAAEKVKDKAAEIRAELAEAAATPALGSGAAGATAGASAGGSMVTQLAAEGGELAAAAAARQLGLHLCGHDVEGVSIAGQETCIILPRLRVAFDLGRCPQHTVLITHGHLDHIGGLPCHVSSRSLLNLEPARYFVHPHYVDKLQRWVEMAQDIEGELRAPWHLQALQPGEELALASGHIVRPFATHHTLPSQGYLIYSYRKKLKAELVGRPGEELKAMREAGQEVTDTYQIPEVAFTGDTSGQLFEDPTTPADIYKAKLLIVEMTFVDESVSWDQARERGHMHITDLVMHAHNFQNEAILLVHFSPRYTRAAILEALEANMPPSLRAKCVPFLNGFN